MRLDVTDDNIRPTFETATPLVQHGVGLPYARRGSEIDAQLAAATHGDAPLVIVAGAGTGKTRTLVARVAALVDRGVDPERILLLTFTRRAADEMLSRAAATCDRRDAARKLTGGTFHAVGYRVVAAHAQTLGLAPDPSVLDQSDARDLMDLLG